MGSSFFLIGLKFAQRAQPPLFQEIINIAKVLFDSPMPEFKNPVGKPLEEITVMRYDHKGPVVLKQCALQHILRPHVEVVGRLIENEKICRREQEFG